jgi:peptidoglycan/xylan/chitin deacetylase (PgdA/CDA1 family)
VEKGYSRQLQELIRSAGLTEHFKLIGPAEDVFPVLKVSDVFCLLSRSEGFSNALLEAMACGLPCVATRVGGNAEAIEEGQSGFLVEAEDPKAAAERILRMLRDPESSRRMGEAGRQIIESRFTVGVMVQNLVDLYEHLLERKGSKVPGSYHPCRVAGNVGRPWLAQVSARKSSGRHPGLKQKIRTAVKWGWVIFLYSTGMLGWAKRRLAAAGGVVVLTFHRVLPDSQYRRTYSTVGMIVRQQTFEEMAGYVAQHYQVVSLADGPTKDKGGRPRLAFSFDDGWDDNARYAVPIARKHGIPLTIFVCPARVGTSFPFWPERVAAHCDTAEKCGMTDQVVSLVATRFLPSAETLRHRNGKTLAEKTIALLKTLPGDLRERVVDELSLRMGGHPETAEQAALHRTLTWEGIRELARDGVTFGSHSLTHQILPKVSLPEAQHELETSKRLLEQHLGMECGTFTYPNGSWTREVRDLVAKAGYTRAFRNDAGAWTSDSDPLLIPRVNISEGSMTGPSERFSRLVFEYAVFWKSFRSGTETSGAPWKKKNSECPASLFNGV